MSGWHSRKWPAEPKPNRAKAGPRGRSRTCNLPGLSGTPLHWATRGWLAEPKLRAKAGAPGQDCTDTKRGLSPVPLPWATGASECGIQTAECGMEDPGTSIGPLFIPQSAIRTPHLRWCRVRDFHPQPLRPERSASCSWANAALEIYAGQIRRRSTKLVT